MAFVILWHILLNIVPSGFIHVATDGRTSLHFTSFNKHSCASSVLCTITTVTLVINMCKIRFLPSSSWHGGKDLPVIILNIIGRQHCDLLIYWMPVNCAWYCTKYVTWVLTRMTREMWEMALHVGNIQETETEVIFRKFEEGWIGVGRSVGKQWPQFL